MKPEPTSEMFGTIPLSTRLAALIGSPVLRVKLDAPKGLKLAPREMAELLGTTEVVLATWRQRKTGPDFELLHDRFIRYPIEGVAEWIATRPWTRARPYMHEDQE